MATTLLVESTQVPVATGKPGRWRAVLLTPGKGSSGTHVEEVMRESGVRAFKKGAKSFVTHNRLQNGEADPFSLWAFLAEDATYEDGVGIVGEIEVLPSWREKVAEVAPHTALSVYVSGTVDESGVITEYLEDPQNGIDLVSYPGRPGSALIEKLYESMKASDEESENGSAPAGRKPQSKESDMEISELAGKVDKVAERLDALTASLTTLTESLKPADIPAEVADLSAVAEAAVTAEIPAEMRQEIYETVKSMTQAEALDVVAKRKALVESIAKQIKESQKPVTVGAGRVSEAGEKSFSLTSLSEVA